LARQRFERFSEDSRAHLVIGILTGILAWFLVRYGSTSLFTVDQNERAIKTSFGRAIRSEVIGGIDTLQSTLREDEKARYNFPKLKVIQPGGPYFKWPWETVHKVSIATQTINMAYDPDQPEANKQGKALEAVTKDQLNTALIGQIRYRLSENNLYPFLFGIKKPLSHMMGYFVAILRERIANFEAPKSQVVDTSSPLNISADTIGVSINDLRKNLRLLNDHMTRECQSSEARYGVILDASLITGIEPPNEVESALAAINTAHNHVSSDISLAQASADQTIEQSKKAVEIETLKAQAEAEPLIQMSKQLALLKGTSSGGLQVYMRNIRLGLFKKARKVFVGVSP